MSNLYNDVRKTTLTTTTTPTRQQDYLVGISSEFFTPDGGTIYEDIGISDLEAQNIQWRALGSTDLSSLDGLENLDALLVLRQTVTPAELELLPRLRHVARWGAGLDRIDLDACQARGVVVTTTPEGGRRPVASAALALLLALAHQIPERDRLVRTGNWARRGEVLGMGLGEMTIGIIGLGTIGREFVRLVAPFGAKIIATRRTPESVPGQGGVEIVALPELLRHSDAVIVMSALTAETQRLLGAEELAMMKPSAFLVNVARGEIIDEAALADALASGRIRGAGLDVFETEPLPDSSPLVSLDNVILAPHSLAWGEEIISGNRRQALAAIHIVADGGVPSAVANPGVLEDPFWANRTRI